ncbi:hypothetical protein SAMN05428945_5777 [Streptomyces sp. 2224.1]|nr:hypothetical protein SAMN05428945_5777 [Streptomyces sp. 2224.1]
MAGRALISPVGGKEPKVDQEAFTAPTSVVLGEVSMAAGASVWYHAVLRADCGPIVLGACKCRPAPWSPGCRRRSGGS